MYRTLGADVSPRAVVAFPMSICEQAMLNWRPSSWVHLVRPEMACLLIVCMAIRRKMRKQSARRVLVELGVENDARREPSLASERRTVGQCQSP